LLIITAFPVNAKQPNFVFFLVDDLGYMDIGVNNPATFYETPNVDRLAREAMRFTNGYTASPVCSPTRYSIMTGKYPSRVNSTDWFKSKREGRFAPAPLNDRMALSELTIAEALKEAGYQTAYVGKWHLGPTAKFWPEAQGFDVNIGRHRGGKPTGPGRYFSPHENPRLSDVPMGEHLTERLTDESLKILEIFQDGPFLLYFAYYTVHRPLQAPGALIEKYQAKAGQLVKQPKYDDEEQIWPTKRRRRVRIVQNHAIYAAMVESMDTSVGRVLDKLEALGLADDTVVFFLC
jgi:arylsulfatase A-like enzyme